MQWDELKAHPGAVVHADDAQPAMGNPHPSLARALIRELHVDGSRHYLPRWIGQDGSARSLIVDSDLATAGKIPAGPAADSSLIRESDMVRSEDF